MIKYSIIVPCFNEEKILEKNIDILHSFLKSNYKDLFEIIIGNDGSTDNTPLIANKLISKYKNISIVNNKKNRGRGSILTKSFIKSKGIILAYIDADLAIELEIIPKLIDSIQNGFDLAIGSKHLKDSKVKYSFIRKLLSNSYSYLVKIILKCPIQDYQCGSKAFKTRSFVKILPKIKEQGWAWDTEVITLAHYNKLKIKEIPASIIDIDERKSKVRVITDSFKMLISILRIRKNHIHK
tara:strand:+ start:432 stop:1148 length:717 start_codon:yes stop_codon:yes gene_type:complete